MQAVLDTRTRKNYKFKIFFMSVLESLRKIIENQKQKIDEQPQRTLSDDERINIFLQKVIKEGNGLQHCQSPERAKEFYDKLLPLLPKNMGCVIIRDKEVNVFS